jgi:Family of unknown function (DUF6496)
MAKYGKAAAKSVESAVRRELKGTLRSGKGGQGGVVTSRKQAIAIGLSEARKKGAKVSMKKAIQLRWRRVASIRQRVNTPPPACQLP